MSCRPVISTEIRGEQPDPKPVLVLQEGFALLEALVAMLVFALGILGMVGLQASMTREQTSAKLRSDAAYLASELVGTMWGDLANLAQYGNNVNIYTRCADWINKVATTMPQGSVTLCVNTDPTCPDAKEPGDVSITVIWTMPGGDRHEYTAVSSVVAAE